VRVVWWTSGIFIWLTFANAASADTIGAAETAKNEVTGKLGTLVRSIGVGDSVSGNEMVRTGTSSAALLRFLDSSNLTIGEASTVLLDKFVFDPEGKAGNGIIKLTKGAMRFVSSGVEPKNFVVATPVATLGPRGTDFVAICDGIKCAVLMTSGRVQICPGRQPYRLDCRDSFNVDQDLNFTLIGPGGKNTGPGKIDPAIVAAITAAIANGDPSPDLLGLASLAFGNLDSLFGPQGNSIDSRHFPASPQ